MRNLLCCLLLAGSAGAQIHQIAGAHIRADVKFLASDLLEGRGVGSRGGDLATEYIAAHLAIAGAKPGGDNGTYFQDVPLVGVETQPSVRLTAVAAQQALSFRWLADFVGRSDRQRVADAVDAEAIFVGHGIVAPEHQWNDFKDVSVQGKILVLFTNEPSSTDEKFFGGKALTYYGRWSYKYEQAVRMGAAGVLIIHTTPTAGYGWDVVRNSWGREEFAVRLPAGQPALAFAGWLTQEAGGKLLALSGHSVAELLRLSDSREFRPIPLGVRIRGQFPAKVRGVVSRNVVGIIPGSDPERSSEAVLFSAHWDHLGVGRAVNGDSIYNGAVDNATGCAILLELARAWGALEQKPRRSAVFLAVTAEESGLLGSAFYAAHPAVPADKTAVALNYDAFYPFGRTADVVVHGAERTTLWPVVESAARRVGLDIRPDPRPEQGSFYRSDHFSLAKAGVPAFSIHMGNEFLGKPQGYGTRMFEEFNAKHYHQPSDEYRDDWDFAGIEQMARFGFLIGVDAANQEKLPAWNEGDEFLSALGRSTGR